MDDKRIQIVTFACGAQQFDLLVRGSRPPHARTCGEDLERVGAQLGRGQGRGFERSARERVDAEAQRLHRPKAFGLGRPNEPRFYLLGRRSFRGWGELFPGDRVLAEAFRADVLAVNRPHRARMHALAPHLGNTVPHTRSKSSDAMAVQSASPYL